MKIDILTLFPEMFEPLNQSILKRARERGLLEINAINIRDFSTNKHKKCDDYPFGGGAGMVMMAQPIFDAVRSVDEKRGARRIFMSPSGKTLTHKMAVELSKEEHLLILCGHYEGVDQRIIDMEFDEEISIGDYVLTGGELGAMVLVDALSRHVDGVIESESLENESFTGGSLEYPQYTRPSSFLGVEVPEVLLSGNHAEIAKWRAKKSEEITKKKRPDLFKEEKQ